MMIMMTMMNQNFSSSTCGLYNSPGDRSLVHKPSPHFTAINSALFNRLR